MTKGGALGEVEVTPVIPLVFEERNRLREIFADPVFRKAWNNALACRPSSFPAGLDSALGPQIGNNRLHQLQGWEMFRLALLREQHERVPKTPFVSDNYPDSGTLEAEMKRKLEPKKP